MEMPMGELPSEEDFQTTDEILEDLLKEMILADPSEEFADDRERDQNLEIQITRFASRYREGTRTQILSEWLQRLYELYQDDRENIDLLLMATTCGRVALRDLPKDSRDYLDLLYRLSPMLKVLYDSAGVRNDLDDAVDAARQLWAILTVNGHWDSKRWEAMENLGATLNERYAEFRDLSDLTEVLQLPVCLSTNVFPPTENVDNMITDADRRASILSIFAQSHENMYERTGLVSDIDKAIEITKKAEALFSAVDTNAVALTNLSRRLCERSKNKLSRSDLENAIKYSRTSVERSGNSPENVHGSCLSGLSTALRSYYDCAGGESVICEAIDRAQEALDLPSQRGLQIRAVWLNDLVAAHLSRYCREHELSDVDQAIRLAKQALDISPPRNSQNIVSLKLLLLALCKRFERRRDKNVYDEAKKVAKDIRASTPEADPIRGFADLNLGWFSHYQYEVTRDEESLDEALKAANRAIAVLPEANPTYANAMSCRGVNLVYLYERSGEGDDLERAIEVLEKAVSLTVDGGNEKVCRLRDLAIALEKRYADIEGDNVDRDRALDLFREASHAPYGLPLDRIDCARSAISIHVSNRQWSEARGLAEEMLKLLPLACRRYESREGQRDAVDKISGIASVAASLSLRDGDSTSALQQLEYGRGLILGYAIDDRSDLATLRRDYPSMARNYISLRYQVDADEIEDYRTATFPAHLPPEWSEGLTGQLTREWREEISRELGKERRKSLKNIEDCVGKIRQLSEYKKFQETLEIDDLKAQATEGPIIVVNISNIRADAIILTPRDVKAVPLHRDLLEAPRFSANTSTFTPNAKNRKALGARDGPGENMYSWLWTSCVKPVLNELKEMGYLDTIRDQCPRVWWIGCGMATSLPFHAAGVDFGPDSFENTLSQVISSYTPTVKALAQSRLRASTYGTGDAKKKSVLLVTMPTTVGLWDLPAVEKEKDAIQRACGDAYDVEELRLPTAESVLKGLEKSDMAHFACHASSDPTNPYDSHLKLQRVVDGGATLDRLTMLAVSKLEAEGRPLVAFLSACSTVQIRAGQFADEGLHLAGAFQVAGFAHVIGALWSAHDDMCAWIAEEFYGEIIRRKQAGATQRVVADALHQAILRARSGDPSRWAPFIHIGI